jgi:hypothetical protein
MSKKLSLAQRLRILYCTKDELTPCGVCLICRCATEIERLEKELEIYKDLYASEDVNNVEKRHGTR